MCDADTNKSVVSLLHAEMKYWNVNMLVQLPELQYYGGVPAALHAARRH